MGSVRHSRLTGRRIRAGASLGALLGCLVGHSSSVAAEASPAAAPESVHLTNGSVLVGRVLSRAEGRIRMFVEGLGELTLDSALVVRGAPAHAMPATPSVWSGNLSAGVLYVS